METGVPLILAVVRGQLPVAHRLPLLSNPSTETISPASGAALNGTGKDEAEALAPVTDPKLVPDRLTLMV
jgi:hypothetical protein